MGIDLTKHEADIREQRLGAITGYRGTITDLTAQADRYLCNRERAFSQTSCCSSGCAHTILAMVHGAVVVNHAPLGCIADTAYTNITNHWNQHFRGEPYTNVPVISSNLDEHDIVFGGADKLRQTLREAYRRYTPQAIFVTTSCASGIIGEDVQGVIDELAAEIPIPIAPVFCDGFRSRVWASGFDAAYHAILTRIVQPAREPHAERVNVINFWGRERKQIGRLFARLGLVPQFIISFSTIEELSRISEAGATVMNCQTLGSYLGAGLEEHFRVPLVKSLPPHGIAGIESWLRELGKVVGKEEAVEGPAGGRAHGHSAGVRRTTRQAAREARLSRHGAGIWARLHGGLAGIGAGDRHGDQLALRQRHDHGGCPVATQKLACQQQGIPYSVNDHQNYEIIALLRELQPDIYITRHVGTTVWAAKMGIPSMAILDEYAAFGYRGLINFGHRLLDTLANRAFAMRLAARVKMPYTAWWQQQQPFTFLEGAQ